MWISARPVLPFPSTNGWMVSKWACATAACTIAGSVSSMQTAHRSSGNSGTASGGGGTKSARQGRSTAGSAQLPAAVDSGLAPRPGAHTRKNSPPS